MISFFRPSLHVAAGVWLLASSLASATTLYKITDLGTLGGQQSVAWAINESGQVVGSAQVGDATGDYRAFLWTPGGGMQDLGTLGGRGSDAYGINDYGQVVGSSGVLTSDGSTPRHATYWGGEGVVDLGTFGGEFSDANDINNSGQIVGYAKNSQGESVAAFWSAAGMSPTSLGSLGGSSVATNISDSGTIIGYSTEGPSSSGTVWDQRPVLWVGGTGISSLASRGVGCCLTGGVNDLGQIVGFDGGGFFLPASGSPISIGSLGGPGSSALTAINNLGQAVGYSSVGSTNHAVIWTEAGGLVDLNTLIQNPSGWSHVYSAYGINEAGQIVGMGETIGSGTHAFLLTPVPMPPAVILFGSALGLMGWLRRKVST